MSPSLEIWNKNKILLALVGHWKTDSWGCCRISETSAVVGHGPCEDFDLGQQVRPNTEAQPQQVARKMWYKPPLHWIATHCLWVLYLAKLFGRIQLAGSSDVWKFVQLYLSFECMINNSTIPYSVIHMLPQPSMACVICCVKVFYPYSRIPRFWLS